MVVDHTMLYYLCSTLAQSIAGLVGFSGAILIFRLQSIQTTLDALQTIVTRGIDSPSLALQVAQLESNHQTTLDELKGWNFQDPAFGAAYGRLERGVAARKNLQNAGTLNLAIGFAVILWSLLQIFLTPTYGDTILYVTGAIGLALLFWYLWSAGKLLSHLFRKSA